jgi:hypothetical protein
LVADGEVVMTFFRRHRGVAALSLSLALSTCAYALVRAARADSWSRRLRWACLAAITAIEAAGVAAFMRSGGDPDAEDRTADAGRRTRTSRRRTT